MTKTTQVPSSYALKGFIVGKIYPDDSPPWLFFASSEQEGYITFAKVDLAIPIPAVSDPKAEQVKAIRAAIDKERGASQNRITEMLGEINSLLALTFDEGR